MSEWRGALGSVLLDATKIKDNKEQTRRMSATMCRNFAAMLNYMAQDRPDLRFAPKDVYRCMAKPAQIPIRWWL